MKVLEGPPTHFFDLVPELRTLFQELGLERCRGPGSLETALPFRSA